ncbi:MFS transporter [Amycolatopsis sp. 195334CR]|uniref:MFS transporter n=1 Tax=Amycolatopsis sp. 195334CR TaxID=2814588 RepID=UPI001A8C188D|nr:MFS transporter [Amycolatopsis sp. 195334CR]MBN6040427.1 MFS transporter [Amycolatopsis sp. 195334CR]
MTELRRFQVLVAGATVSNFGGYLNMVALNLFVLERTGSAVSMGLFMTLRLAAGFAAGLAGGTVAARLPRKPVLIACDLGQAAALLALVAATAGGGDSGLVLLPVVAVATGLLGNTTVVLLRSSVPDLVGAANRMRANGMLVTGRAIAMTAGFATGGVLVAALGYHAAFVIDAVTFGVSAATVAVLALAFPAPSKATAPRAGAPVRRWARVAGLAAVPPVLAILGIRALDAFGSASHNVGVPVFASQVMPANPATLAGWFLATWAVGLLGAHQVVQRLHRDRESRHDERAFAAGTCAMSAAFVLAFALPWPWLLVTALVAGIADGYTEITYTTRLQAEPDPDRAHYFGFAAVAENVGLGAGLLAAAALTGLWPVVAVAGLMHGLVLVVAIACVAAGVLGKRGRTEAADAVGER